MKFCSYNPRELNDRVRHCGSCQAFPNDFQMKSNASTIMPTISRLRYGVGMKSRESRMTLRRFYIGTSLGAISESKKGKGVYRSPLSGGSDGDRFITNRPLIVLDLRELIPKGCFHSRGRVHN